MTDGLSLCSIKMKLTKFKLNAISQGLLLKEISGLFFLYF